MTALQQILTKPCLIEPVDGLIIAEPLQFISTRSVYARGRHSILRAGMASNGETSVSHADLNTYNESYNHGA